METRKMVDSSKERKIKRKEVGFPLSETLAFGCVQFIKIGCFVLSFFLSCIGSSLRACLIALYPILR